MDPIADDVAHEFRPFIRVYKDGRIERFPALPLVPPALDPITGVQSKDVVISSEPPIKARIFIPKINGPDQKLPLVLHYHGGAFCIGSPFDDVSQIFLTTLVSQSNVVAISVDYRLAPDHPLPIAHHDSWSALQWIAIHSDGKGPDPWINRYADLGRVFLPGESAGANLAHYVAVRAGATGLVGVKLKGLIMLHSYFVTREPEAIMPYLYPTCSGLDDPVLNPGADPDLAKLGCPKVFLCVAENDWLKQRGLDYYEILKKSGWGGTVEFMENEGEG
ncbi:hypothetical protein RJ639_042109 [Escallonia herrerae]|uniref:Alpha/beta hydrolase fold-3 domain-containing protein n=1 Tax=Escallonia herrerae TaxID=1293975 RepID=A0AA88WD68_9ASTE|nr:hypothetical protein RJ639_042109 [Escallonia herrerae]